MSSSTKPASVSLHGRSYNLPTRPTVIVCIDGFDPTYLTHGASTNSLPTMKTWLTSGFHTTALSAMPSVTNTNNVSIITGVPSSVHGVSGNYYLDKATNQEVMVLDDSTMHGSTVLEQMSGAGVRVAAVTAKDKLRRIINHGLEPERGAICFSAQHADKCTVAEHGIDDVEAWLGKPTPSMYSADLSLFVLDAGLKLLQERKANLLYLTLSDYVQHKHAPGSPEADSFMQAIDTRLGEFQRLGALVAVTGDHGMSAKSCDGAPNVLFLEDVLTAGWPDADARVLCPIADPFVKYHGALGGLVRVHLTGKWQPEDVGNMLGKIRQLPQVQEAYTGEEGAGLFEMPPEREGELLVIAKPGAVIGGSQAKHDLSQLGEHPLRSHGGSSEREIPLLRSEVAAGADRQRVWHNYDVFELALNY